MAHVNSLWHRVGLCYCVAHARTCLTRSIVVISDKDFLSSWSFVWKVLVTTSISCIPLFILMYLKRKFAPSSYSKLT